MSQRLKSDIQRLAKQRPGVVALPEAADPASIQAKTGLGTAARVSAGSAGIASPLVEQDYDARTWHGVRSITSTDGLFTLEYDLLATVTMQDANGQQVILQFLDVPT